MNRREAVQRISLMLGGMVSAPILAGAMGEKTYFGPSIAYTPEQEALISEVADTIIPTTKTPGAKAAKVEEFITRVVKDCFTEDEQKKFYAGLDNIESIAKSQYSKAFAQLDTTQRKAVVTKIMDQDKWFFGQFKSLTVTGYFISEIGATQALDYLPIPGRFEGTFPLKPDQKTWAL